MPMILHLKNERVEARTVQISFKPCEFQPGEVITFAADLLMGGMQPSEMVTITHLTLPKKISSHFRLESATVEDLDLVSIKEAFPLEEDGPSLPDDNAFHLLPIALSPLNRVVITLTNISEAVLTFEGSLVCQVKPVMGMWFGENVGTKKEWYVEILGRGLNQFLDWRREGRRLKAEVAQRKAEAAGGCQCDCHGGDFAPLYDTDDEPSPEPRRERLRDHLRLLAIDVVSVASFPFKAALHLTTKALSDLTTIPAQEPTGNYLLDCGKTTIEAGKAANIKIQCQVSFRPSMLIIPPTLIGYFDISDIKVGKNSQFLSPSILPASAFSFADGTPIALKMDVLRPGQWVTISVQNKSEHAQAFTATLVGRTESWTNG